MKVQPIKDGTPAQIAATVWNLPAADKSRILDSLDPAKRLLVDAELARLGPAPAGPVDWASVDVVSMVGLTRDGTLTGDDLLRAVVLLLDEVRKNTAGP